MLVPQWPTGCWELGEDGQEYPPDCSRTNVNKALCEEEMTSFPSPSISPSQFQPPSCQGRGLSRRDWTTAIRLIGKGHGLGVGKKQGASPTHIGKGASILHLEFPATKGGSSSAGWGKRWEAVIEGK